MQIEQDFLNLSTGYAVCDYYKPPTNTLLSQPPKTVNKAKQAVSKIDKTANIGQEEQKIV